MTARGPLAGVRVLEFAAIGPVPLCGMLLADLGADVVRVDRPGPPPRPDPIMGRGRASIVADLKTGDGIALAGAAMERADVLLEGLRPGVMERLGLGPDDALARNPRLVYGRMTGWGQDGPLAARAGHDLTYLALSGMLDAFGAKNRVPRPPLNVVGDYGGGALFLAFGVTAALVERERSGRGQVVDAAIVDGTAAISTLFLELIATRFASTERGRSLLGGDAPYYRCYRCADGKYVAVAALEPRFRAVLCARLGLAPELLVDDPAGWGGGTEALEAVFETKTRDDWAAYFADADACVAPVLTFEEAPAHPHHAARGTYVAGRGVVEPAPAPRFSRTPGSIGGAAPAPGEGGIDALRRWGVRC